MYGLSRLPRAPKRRMPPRPRSAVSSRQDAEDELSPRAQAMLDALEAYALKNEAGISRKDIDPSGRRHIPPSGPKAEALSEANGFYSALLAMQKIPETAFDKKRGDPKFVARLTDLMLQAGATDEYARYLTMKKVRETIVAKMLAQGSREVLGKVSSVVVNGVTIPIAAMNSVAHGVVEGVNQGWRKAQDFAMQMAAAEIKKQAKKAAAGLTDKVASWFAPQPAKAPAMAPNLNPIQAAAAGAPGIDYNALNQDHATRVTQDLYQRFQDDVHWGEGAYGGQVDDWTPPPSSPGQQTTPPPGGYSPAQVSTFSGLGELMNLRADDDSAEYGDGQMGSLFTTLFGGKKKPKKKTPAQIAAAAAKKAQKDAIDAAPAAATSKMLKTAIYVAGAGLALYLISGVFKKKD